MNARQVPHLTARQMREVDRVATAVYGIELGQMMENAGRHLAALARRRFLGGNARHRSVLVLAGAGGNGGGGLVCARMLHNWGVSVHVITDRPSAAFQGVPAHQLSILLRVGVPVASPQPIDGSETEEPPAAPAGHPSDAVRRSGDPPAVLQSASLPDADLVVDALIGYGLAGPPRGFTAALIRAANAHPAPRLSLDLPSGLDATTGEALDPTVRADATLTLALPKEGLRAPSARAWVGELYLADIGIPPEVYGAVGLDREAEGLFSEEEILPLEPC